MPRIAKPDPIDYLVSRKHPGLTGREAEIREERREEIAGNRLIDANYVNRLYVRPSTAEESPRPTPSEVAAKAALTACEAAASAYRVKLMAESPTRIEELQRSEWAKQRDEEEAARSFNQASAAADFDHYCKCARWTLDEAVALSFGKEPKLVNWESIQLLVGVSAFARSYERLRDLTKRALSAGQLFDPVSPSIYLSWAKKLNIPLPDGLVTGASNSGISLKGWQDLYEIQKKHTEELAEQYKQHKNALVEQHKKTREDWSNKYKSYAASFQEKLDAAKAEIEILKQQKADRPGKAKDSAKHKDLGARERESLQLIALVGALRGYKYDPKKRNNASTKIHLDLDRMGLPISDDTIRNHLATAAEQLPPNWRDRLPSKPNSDIG